MRLFIFTAAAIVAAPVAGLAQTATGSGIDTATSNQRLTNEFIAEQANTAASFAALQAQIDALKALLPPSGAMYATLSSAVPDGWAVCGGMDGRFIAVAGSKYAIGQTGGADTVTLTPEQVPYLPSYYQMVCPHFRCSDTNHAAVGGRNADMFAKMRNGPTPHENRPEFIAVRFLCKQ